MRVFPFFFSLCSFCVAACTESSVETAGVEQDGTALLSTGESHIETLHSVAYHIETSPAFSIIAPKHRTDEFNGVPYQISLAAFIREDAAIMIHAETVIDGSGVSNYDNLPVSEWPGPDFRSNGAVCFELSAKSIEGEHDPEWLQANGFDPTGVLMFGQYFAVSNDYNDEVVISLMQHVDSCDNETDNAAAYAALLAEISVTEID